MSVVWTSHDDNEDELTFALYVRGEGRKKLASAERQNRAASLFLGFHDYAGRRVLPEAGGVRFAIQSGGAGADAPTRESERFEVDNSQPAIQNLRAAAAKERAGDFTVTFEVHDPATAVARAEYSLDSGDWSVVFPKGDLSDSREESYRNRVASSSSAESIRFRCAPPTATRIRRAARLPLPSLRNRPRPV